MSFLNHPTVHNNMATIIMDFRTELKRAEEVHEARTGTTVAAVDNFDNYFKSLMTRINTRIEAFATRWLNTIDATWSNINTADGIQIRTYSASIRTEAQIAEVNTQGFFDDI